MILMFLAEYEVNLSKRSVVHMLSSAFNFLFRSCSSKACAMYSIECLAHTSITAHNSLYINALLHIHINCTLSVLSWQCSSFEQHAGLHNRSGFCGTSWCILASYIWHMSSFSSTAIRQRGWVFFLNSVAATGGKVGVFLIYCMMALSGKGVCSLCTHFMATEQFKSLKSGCLMDCMQCVKTGKIYSCTPIT